MTGILTLFEATLTLPGIAGIILTVGMAVDANVLIFERIKEEIKKENNTLVAFDLGYTKARLRLIILRYIQNRSFRLADGVIFLTKHASDMIQASCGLLNHHTIIPHGVGKIFKEVGNDTRWLEQNKSVLNCVYVSETSLHKHQWNVVSAVSLLRKEGFAVELSLVGNSYYKALKSLNKTIDRLDTNRDFVKYRGGIDYQDLPSIYNETDIFVFASSCENLPIILLEAMASRLPIACSQLSPMPEILRDAGVYFDPFSVISIKESIRYLINNPDSSYNFSQKAGLYSKNFSWEACADKTFAFINKNLKNQRNEKN